MPPQPKEEPLLEPLLSPPTEEPINKQTPPPAAPPQNEFSIQTELLEMYSLGLPLAISFFCRMGMASTDSAFVGHIHDTTHSTETYLAAVVLSDMCVNVFIT